MTNTKLLVSAVRLVMLMGIGCTLIAQQRGPGGPGGPGGPAGPASPAATAAPAQGGGRGAGGRGGAPASRIPLFFREEWKNEANTYEPKIEQIHVANPNLELKLLGPTGKEILIAGTANNETNPIHPWTGMCTTPCGLTLRDKTRSVDLTGLARIKWNTKMSGLHQIRPVIRLASGALLVGDFADGSNVDWQEREFNLTGIKWYTLDPERGVTTGSVLANVDLSKVDEVGFIDLMPASGHGQGGWADVAKFEVYGRPVPRQ